MRNITFDGRLGKDAEIMTARNGKQYLRFSVANNSYYNGEDHTDWFDVVTYDPFTVEKRAAFLKKGTYVIVTGGIVTEFNVSKGNAYINHKVTAVSIDTPKLGKPNSEETPHTEEEPQLSVYTGGTPTVKPQIEPEPVPVSVSNYTPQYTDGSTDNEDDLPF